MIDIEKFLPKRDYTLRAVGLRLDQPRYLKLCQIADIHNVSLSATAIAIVNAGLEDFFDEEVSDGK